MPFLAIKLNIDKSYLNQLEKAKVICQFISLMMFAKANTISFLLKYLFEKNNEKIDKLEKPIDEEIFEFYEKNIKFFDVDLLNKYDPVFFYSRDKNNNLNILFKHLQDKESGKVIEIKDFGIDFNEKNYYLILLFFCLEFFPQSYETLNSNNFFIQQNNIMQEFINNFNIDMLNDKERIFNDCLSKTLSNLEKLYLNNYFYSYEDFLTRFHKRILFSIYHKEHTLSIPENKIV